MNQHLSGRLEIRPSRAKFVGMILGSLVFVFFSLIMLQKGSTILGLLTLGIFGSNAVFLMTKLSQPRVSMVLTGSGLEWQSLVGSVLIPWFAMESVGIAKQFGQQLVGIRLRTYDPVLANMSQELASFLTRSVFFLKVIDLGNFASKGTHLVTRLWSALEGSPDPYAALKKLGKVGDLAGLLCWSREAYGYDILFGWSEQDRSAPDLANLIDDWRRAAASSS